MVATSKSRSSKVDLTAFFSPASIAMIGASDDPSTLRGRILDFLLQRGYRGTLHLISPNHDTIRGIRTVKAVRDIQGPIDVVLVAVRADLTEDILAECAAAGAKFAVCFSSGFAEEGEEGKRRQDNLTKLAQQTGMRICGPNAAGFFNVTEMIPVTFTRSADASRETELGKLRPGPVGIVAQSGGLGFALVNRAASQHGVGFSGVVSSGNEADLESLDFVDHLVDDPHTRVIMLLLEALKNPQRLADVAGRAARAGKPILAAKFGRTTAGSRAADSHAARLTGSDTGYSAAFHRHGVIRVEDEEELCDLAAAFARCPLPQGKRVGIVTTSGGAGVWMADACELAGLEVPVLDEATQQALSAYVPSFGSTVNPVDMTAQISINPADKNAEKQSGKLSPLVGILKALDDSPLLDAVVMVANLSDGEFLAREQDTLAKFVPALKKPLLLYTHAQASPESLLTAWGMGLSVFGSTRRTAQVLRVMHDYALFLDAMREATPDAAPTLAGQFPSRLGDLCEYEAKALLRDHGFVTPREQLAKTAEEAVAIAKRFGGKVALKIQSRQIQHKTEVDGVVLGLQSDDAVRTAFNDLLTRGKKAVPDADIHGVLVAEMARPGLEMAIGVVRDADFGPMMMVGLGGIHIEVLKDVAWELLPVRKATALDMLKRLRGYALLEGVRGQARRDIDALAELMEKLSRLVEHSGDLIAEIDLNPVFLQADGEGLDIVDAMMVGRDKERT